MLSSTSSSSSSYHRHHHHHPTKRREACVKVLNNVRASFTSGHTIMSKQHTLLQKRRRPKKKLSHTSYRRRRSQSVFKRYKQRQKKPFIKASSRQRSTRHNASCGSRRAILKKAWPIANAQISHTCFLNCSTKWGKKEDNS